MKTLDEAIELLAVESGGDGYCCNIRGENGECCLVPGMRAALEAVERSGWKLVRVEEGDTQ